LAGTARDTLPLGAPHGLEESCLEVGQGLAGLGAAAKTPIEVTFLFVGYYITDML